MSLKRISFQTLRTVSPKTWTTRMLAIGVSWLMQPIVIERYFKCSIFNVRVKSTVSTRVFRCYPRRNLHGCLLLVSRIYPTILRLCVHTILQGKMNEVFNSFGVCCSSWVLTSRGSTGRSWICPMGNLDFERVTSSNRMVGRSGFKFIFFQSQDTGQDNTEHWPIICDLTSLNFRQGLWEPLNHQFWAIFGEHNGDYRPCGGSYCQLSNSQNLKNITNPLLGNDFGCVCFA